MGNPYCPIDSHGPSCRCGGRGFPGERKTETFYTEDSLTGQTLRVVKQERPGRLDVYTSDATTSGKVHDHSYLNFKDGQFGNINRGQQKKGF